MDIISKGFFIMVVEMDNHNELKGVFEFFDNGWWERLNIGTSSSWGLLNLVMKIVTTCKVMFFETPSRHTNKGINILTSLSWWNDYGDSYYKKGCNFKWF